MSIADSRALTRCLLNLPPRAIGPPLAVVRHNMHENGQKINRKPRDFGFLTFQFFRTFAL
jgi:hypothetical protein